MGTVRYTTVNGEILAEKRNGVRSLYVPDALGSTLALLNSSQTATDTFTYWPYGETNVHTGSNPTPFQFVGTLGYYQDSTSKTYVRARHLDTLKGRWMTLDPIGIVTYLAGGPLYGYADNNPINSLDPSGLQSKHRNKPAKPKCPAGYKAVYITGYGDNAGCTGSDCNIAYPGPCGCKPRLPQAGDCAIDQNNPVCGPGQYVSIIKNNGSKTSCQVCDAGQGHGGLDIKVPGPDDPSNVDLSWKTGWYCVKCSVAPPGWPGIIPF